MNKPSFKTFNPDWIVPPGSTIADLLEEHGWTQTEFASRMDYTKKHVNLLIKGKCSITEDAAIKLERVLGSKVSFWLNLEVRYRESLARKEDLNRLNESTSWLRKLPVKFMTKLGWIKDRIDKRELVDECLKFFGVASVNAWEIEYEKPIAAFRSSSKIEKQKGATSVWLRQAEKQALEINCSSFNRSLFLLNLNIARQLTLEENFKNSIIKLIELCANAGIALVVLQTPDGCPISGATRWLGQDKALIILSDRYKTNDQFWFTFFHEAAHLLFHSKKLLFIDTEGQLDDSQENEANSFASNHLIPSKYVNKLYKLPKSEIAVKFFAAEIGIAPGIVVGRMQREGILPWTHLNKLKINIHKVSTEVN